MRALKLISLFEDNGLDAYLTFMSDNHLNEFINNEDNRVKYLTNFTGTSGTVITIKPRVDNGINNRFGGLLTDGRYYSMAEKQLTNYSLVKSDEESIGSYLKRALSVEASDESEDRHNSGKIRVGLNLRYISYSRYKKLKNDDLIEYVEMENDLVDQIWKVKPNRQFNEIIDMEQIEFDPRDPINMHIMQHHPILGRIQGDDHDDLRDMYRSEDNANPLSSRTNISGSNRTNKINRIRHFLKNGQAFIFTELDTIAWIFNLRGTDLRNNQVFWSYCIISNEETILFLNESSLKTNINEGINDTKNLIKILPYSSFESFISENLDYSEVLVSGECSAFIGNLLEKANKKLIFTDEIKLLQSIKNKIELIGYFRANLYDSIALLELFDFIEGSFSKEISISEIDISNKLIDIKKNINLVVGNNNSIGTHKNKPFDSYFISPSFDSVVSINSPDLHHSNSNRVLQREDILLIDSGSQYIFGTTDITRTINVKVQEKYMDSYTLVLKGTISNLIMQDRDKSDDRPINSSAIDKNARKYLLRYGFDYQSATGHGIGIYAHEHPPRIYTYRESEEPEDDRHTLHSLVDSSSDSIHSNTDINSSILNYQSFSIEPGFYEEYGIRLEDVIVKLGHLYNMTYLPYQISLINKSLLSGDEVKYLNKYHKKTLAYLKPFIKGESKYLTDNTAEL